MPSNQLIGSTVQSLKANPALYQMTAILQLSLVDLRSYLVQQAEENPVIELDWPQETAGRHDIRKTRRLASSGQLNDAGWETWTAEPESMQDYLAHQLGLSGLDGTLRRVGAYLIGNLDSSGYLRTTVEEAAQLCGVPSPAVLTVLREIQSWEPRGIGARDLRECLLLQLPMAHQNEEINYYLEVLLKDHWDCLSSSGCQIVAQSLRVSRETAERIREALRSLNPRPAQSLGTAPRAPVIPDLYAFWQGGRMAIEVNEELLPTVRYASEYEELFRHTTEKDTRRYLRDAFARVGVLQKALEQRRKTMQSAAEIVVNWQLRFFTEGSRGLRALTLQDVAEQIGVHESTVSRATAGKFVQSPFGLFPLKKFFARGLTDQTGHRPSTSAVKEMLRNMVSAETDTARLSDLRLQKQLAEAGITISRRTVAKYRQELGVASSWYRQID